MKKYTPAEVDAIRASLLEDLEALKKEFPDYLKRYENGDQGVAGFFVGKLMKMRKEEFSFEIANEVALTVANHL